MYDRWLACQLTVQRTSANGERALSNTGRRRTLPTMRFDLLTATVLVAGIAPTAHAQRSVITGGHYFDVNGGTMRINPGMLIVAGRLASIGPLTEADRAGAEVFTVEDGQYLLPGLFDLHAHYAIDLFGDGRVDDTTAYPVLFLANGVTSTFPAGEMDPHRMRRLRIAIDNGDRPGPRIYNSGPYFGSWRTGWSNTMTADSIHQEVDYWIAMGVKAFKAKGIRADHLRALIERAHQHGVTVTGHLGSGFRNTVNPRDAILMGIDRIEHFIGGDAMTPDRSAYDVLESMDPDTDEFRSIVELYLERGVNFDATMSAYGYYAERDPEVYAYFTDEQRFLTPYMREIIERREPRRVLGQFESIYWNKRRLVKAFYDAGGHNLITLGTDHPSWGEFFSAFGAHREMLSLALSGIPTEDVLRIGTINGARALGVSDHLGSLEVGKLADLFVVDGNPLDDIRNTRNVRWVMRGGRRYDAAELLASVEGTLGPQGPSDEYAWRPRGNR